MADLFEIPQVTIVNLPQDLHYQLTEPSTGEIVAQVSPVAVGAAWREGTLGRLFRKAKRARSIYPGETYHVPRITFRVAGARNETLFFVDRADKLIGNPCIPNSAVVAADGGVLGYITNDHYHILRAVDPPVDANGIATVRGMGFLLDHHNNVVGEVVRRAPWTPHAMKAGLPPDEYAVSFEGPDGSVWGRRKGEELIVEFNPDASRTLRILMISNLICGKADERLYTPFTTSGYTPPEPLEPATEPYPGYQGVHESYMQYQEKFIKWFQRNVVPSG